MSLDDRTISSVDRRRFLGLAGASLASTGLPPSETAAGGVAAGPDASSTEKLFGGSIREIAVDPAMLGPSWQLTLDEITHVSDSRTRTVGTGDSTSALIRRMSDGSPSARMNWEALEQELIRNGLCASSELFYSSKSDASGLVGSYIVKVGVFGSVETAVRFLRRTISGTSEETGYVPVSQLGDEAFEAIEFKWSLKGKIRFRRRNVYVSVLPFAPEPNAKPLARLLDHRILELIG